MFTNGHVIMTVVSKLPPNPSPQNGNAVDTGSACPDEFHYNDLCAQAPIAYHSLDENGCLLVVNEKWLETFRYRREEVIGRWFGDLLVEELRTRFRTELFPRFKQAGVVNALELEIVRGDGARRIISGDGRIARDPDGSFRKTHCVFKDVTEERTREDQLRHALLQAEMANKTKSLFLANMSHELRTPLNAIIGFSDMMAEATIGPLSKDYMEYARIVRDSGRHLLQIINDVLDMSRIEAGKIELYKEPVNIGGVLDETIELVRLDATEKGVRIVCAYDHHTLRVDRLRIKQVFLNLLSNAIKFSAGGTVTVLTANRPSIYSIAISDTGIGMSETEVQRAQTPFGQVGTSLLTKKSEGVGLGLSLAKQFVELHDGTLSIASRKGTGTTVTITLPEGDCAESTRREEGAAAVR